MDYFYSPKISNPITAPTKLSVSPFAPTVSYADAEAYINLATPSEPRSTIADPLVNIMFFLYGNIYGRVKGDSCLFYPTCSHFGHLAIRDNGIIRGIWMTGGRLVRAHFNFDRYYPVVEAPEGVRWFDPPVHETFEFYTHRLKKLAPTFQPDPTGQDIHHHEND